MTWKHDELHDDEIRRALADLPRERAAEGFTEQVLRRLDESPEPRPTARETFRHFRRQPALAGAALGLVLVVVLLAVGALRPAHDSTGSEDAGPAVAQTDGPVVDSPTASLLAHPQNATQKAATSGEQRLEARALLEELRREHSRLTRDLRDLRELAEGSRVMYVSGDESLDFVLELSAEPPPETGSGVRPASLREPAAGGQRFF